MLLVIFIMIFYASQFFSIFKLIVRDLVIILFNVV